MNNNVTEKKTSLAGEGKGFAAIWKKVLSFFRGSGSLEKRKAMAGWVFVLPFVIGLVLIYVPVIFESLRLSCGVFVRGEITDFVWFDNYREALFVDTNFVQTLVAGIQQLVFDVPAIVIFSLFVAVILNQKMLGRAAFRAIFFIPVILSTGLIDQIDASNAMVDHMENGSMDDGTGTSASGQIVNAVDVQRLFSNMMVGQELVVYITQLVNNIYNIVNRSGVQILIFLAGLQSISPSIYEACTIDGATAWETFWKVTFPMIGPMILVNALYTIIDSFTSASNTVMTYISGIYDGGKIVLSTAMSWIYFAIVILIIVAFMGIASAYVFYQRRDL